MFIEIFLPHSKPLIVGSINFPLSQGSFTDTIAEFFQRLTQTIQKYIF